jgi:AcrR family transcriptional regulator
MMLRPTLEKREERERVRAALLRAALRLAAAHGFASLGLREVSREAGIAPTSFYRHFADMEELGMALIRELAGRALSGLDERMRAAPREQLAAELVDGMLFSLADDPELWRFVISERVGAFGGFRSLLRAELSTLSRTLYTEWSSAAALPLAAADAALATLLDGAARALDEPPARRAALRDGLVWALHQLSGLPRSAP